MSGTHHPSSPRRAWPWSLRRLLAVVCWWLLAALPAAAQEEVAHPHSAADTSSPRATLSSFVTACNEVYCLIEEEGIKYRTDERAAAIALQALRCLDLSKVPPAVQRNIAGEAAVCLKETLDRIELPQEREIPDAEEMKKVVDEGGQDRWTLPNTEIVIAKVEEGPRAGEYLFSPGTVDRAREFFYRVRELPYQPNATEGFYDWYLSEPGWMIPTAWIHGLPQWTRKVFYGVTLWQWIGLVITLLTGVAVMILAYRIGHRRAAEKLKASVFRYVVTIWFPIAAMLVPLVLKFFVIEQLAIRSTVGALISIALDTLFLIAVIVVLIGAANRIAEIVISSPRINPKGIDAQFIRLGFRVLSIVGAVVVLLEGGRYIGIPLTTLLAGAGVGGLTIALAAQDTLKNLFGSMMVILDRPYRVGERIVVKRYDGVVEEIGLRSTRIRLLTGHLATIPNEEMARTDVENIGRRLHIRRIQDIALRYDLPSEKVQKAAQIVRQLLEDHEGMKPDFPPRIYFNEFRRDCLNLRVIYWYHPPNYWDFLAHSEKLNVRIMEEFEAAGIEFAMPTTTTFVSQDQQQPLEMNVALDAAKQGLPESPGGRSIGTSGEPR